MIFLEKALFYAVWGSCEVLLKKVLLKKVLLKKVLLRMEYC